VPAVSVASRMQSGRQAIAQRSLNWPLAVVVNGHCAGERAAWAAGSGAAAQAVVSRAGVRARVMASSTEWGMGISRVGNVCPAALLQHGGRGVPVLAQGNVAFGRLPVRPTPTSGRSRGVGAGSR